MSENDYDFNEVIHATLLNPYLSKETFHNNCELIILQRIYDSNFTKHMCALYLKL